MSISSRSRRKCLATAVPVDERAVRAAKVLQERIGQDRHYRGMRAAHGRDRARQMSLSGRRPIVIRCRSSLISAAAPPAEEDELAHDRPNLPAFSQGSAAPRRPSAETPSEP